jgi:hypothetical protein
MSIELFDRFTGVAQVRDCLQRSLSEAATDCVAVVAPGKNEWAIHQVLAELEVEVRHNQTVKTVVVGTLSPGPMVDAYEQYSRSVRTILPWEPRAFGGARCAAAEVGS